VHYILGLDEKSPDEFTAYTQKRFLLPDSGMPAKNAN